MDLVIYLVIERWIRFIERTVMWAWRAQQVDCMSETLYNAFCLLVIPFWRFCLSHEHVCIVCASCFLCLSLGLSLSVCLFFFSLCVCLYKCLCVCESALLYVRMRIRSNRLQVLQTVFERYERLKTYTHNVHIACPKQTFNSYAT